MSRPTASAAIAVLTALLFAGCAMHGPQTPSPLRVGVTPTYPPMIFQARGQMTGAEADLARRLAGALSRPLQFVELRWEEQIPALVAGRTDTRWLPRVVTVPR